MRPHDQAVLHTYRGSIPQESLFSGLPPNCGGSLAAIERRVILEPNAEVINIDDPSEHVFILRQGQARIYVNAPAEENEASDLVTLNEYHGIIEALSGECFRYEMKAITRCEFGVIDREDLLTALSRESELCFRLATILSRMNRQILNEVSTA
jgi:CRP-like cAMP-binding protein